uniref:Uncharacterized protein n=1 Tax=Oryctolagus cuniculus TaxID=9986 RepID=G1U7E4_RABIT
MDRCGELVLCLWLLTSLGGTTETSSEEIQSQMRKMEVVEQPAAAQHVHRLEQMLLNASFQGHNLTVQTSTIQALVFRLGCNFTGLSLGSATPEQARPGHSMQFPAELTPGSLQEPLFKLRLICVYFLTTHFFQVSAGWVAEGGALLTFLLLPGLRVGTGLGGSDPLWSQLPYQLWQNGCDLQWRPKEPIVCPGTRSLPWELPLPLSVSVSSQSRVQVDDNHTATKGCMSVWGGAVPVGPREGLSGEGVFPCWAEKRTRMEVSWGLWRWNAPNRCSRWPGRPPPGGEGRLAPAGRIRGKAERLGQGLRRHLGPLPMSPAHSPPTVVLPGWRQLDPAQQPRGGRPAGWRARARPQGAGQHQLLA